MSAPPWTCTGLSGQPLLWYTLHVQSTHFRSCTESATENKVLFSGNFCYLAEEIVGQFTEGKSLTLKFINDLGLSCKSMRIAILWHYGSSKS